MTTETLGAVADRILARPWIRVLSDGKVYMVRPDKPATDGRVTQPICQWPAGSVVEYEYDRLPMRVEIARV